MISQALLKPLIGKLIKDLNKKGAELVAFEFEIESEGGFNWKRVIVKTSQSVSSFTPPEFEKWAKEK